ncbi:hypothetical protein [Pseudomonas aeruginosa]|uniref:hypothetical protein n=1 Tax=Pseudomonas aeruginosa TaxID=287 RepID=UPI000E31040A|nr:hypothetical protein [Pseudomonas aeruginosa]MBA5037064.1 hypothetical protein [Pseudomonas aeruginosa]NPZ89739.1 hypothetical protein [Pseudomonas aeruginosa]HBP1366547.1 hypothetical protein [Pseudomonas aeruginosa]HBP5378457.1 hypothetical protein [Pseudomonas aeruginosa]HCE7948115.1 hypothetical protein [Pseudomonas aeruginosa]
MNKANECTCPSGDGSLVHPCPAHPAVEQVGGDERAAFEAAFAAMGRPVCRADYDQDAYGTPFDDGGWTGWQARAALAQPSPVRSSLLINGYQLRAALDFIAPDGTAEQLKSEACIEWRQQDADFLEAGLYAFCAEYPEEGGVLLDEEPTTAQPSPLQSDQAEAERPALWAVHAQGPDELYAAFSREDAEKHAAELNALPMPEGIAVGAVVVPSPWPAVQHWQYLAEQEQDHKNEIAGRLRQLERICEGLPQDAIDGGWTVQGIRGYAKRLEDQLKAALARVAELETALEPFAAVADAYDDSEDDDHEPYTDMGCDDSLRLTLGQHRAGRIALEGRTPQAQAQHSVPDHAELLQALERTHAGHMVGHDQSDQPKGGYSDGYVNGFGECIKVARKVLAAAPGNSVPQAWLDVQAERRRQITAEGWTPEHDDEHADGQMAQAAGCYALHAGGIGTDWPDGRQNGAALFWPWDKDSWKPTTPRRDLVKACALALAEIERLDRAGISQSPQPGATTASS